MQTKQIKYRNEIKYVCSEQQLQMIEQRIKNICKRDSHTGESGIYSVRSVYFDDYHDSCLRENEAGVNVREKFRIRIYNGNLDRIILECKSKQNSKNHKESCLLTKEQCDAILQGRYVMREEEPPLLRKLFLQNRIRQMKPKVIVQYERTPYIYDAGNVRITFDRNVSGSDKVLAFGDKNLYVRPVMPAGQHILEVKYDDFLPDYLRTQMQLSNLQQTAFSKYCICRKG